MCAGMLAFKVEAGGSRIEGWLALRSSDQPGPHGPSVRSVLSRERAIPGTFDKKAELTTV